MKRIGIALGCAALLGSAGWAEPAVEGLEAKIAAVCKVGGCDTWYGHRRIKFDFRGHAAWVVEPSVGPLQGKPWTWAAMEPKDRKWTPLPQMPINCTETVAKAGGKLTVDARPFCGHHPHGFDYENRQTILDFLMAK